jgi:dCMP deaminase
MSASVGTDDMAAYRPSVDEYFLGMAELASYRGTCARRRVGCILVDRNNRVLSTGYNGVASGLPHCTDTPCPGAGLPSGTGLHLCQAIHAEANALISCRDPEDIYAAYCTASPCVQCVRMLMNTPCIKIVFAEEYPHSESRDLWTFNRVYGRDDRQWIHIPKG